MIFDKKGYISDKDNDIHIFYYNKKLHKTELKKTIISSALLMIIIPGIFVFAQSDMYSLKEISTFALYHFVTVFLALALIHGIRIFNVSKACEVIQIDREKIVIDKKVFDLDMIKNGEVTPFEYHSRRIVSFEYEDRKYSYYFGDNTWDIRATNLYRRSYFSEYILLCHQLHRRGFKRRY